MKAKTHEEMVNNSEQMVKFHQSGMSYSQVALEMGLSESYVKQNIRAKTRKFLENRELTNDDFGKLSTMVRNILLRNGINTVDKLEKFVVHGGKLKGIGEKGWTAIFIEYGIYKK